MSKSTKTNWVAEFKGGPLNGRKVWMPRAWKALEGFDFREWPKETKIVNFYPDSETLSLNAEATVILPDQEPIHHIYECCLRDREVVLDSQVFTYQYKND